MAPMERPEAVASALVDWLAMPATAADAGGAGRGRTPRLATG